MSVGLPRHAEEAVGLAPTRASRPLPVFGTGPSSGRIASVIEPSVGVAPTTSSVPGTRSDSLSYKGLTSRLAGTTRTCDPRLRRAVLSSTGYGELSVDGRGRTCTLRFRRPVPSPFGHVDVAPPTGLEPVTFCSTGSCSGRLSYGGVVRALGLEPSLVRGKSPVPYLSGVTRVVGREGIERPVSEDGWSTASCAPWRDRPMSKPHGGDLDDDVSAVVKELMAGLDARRESRLGRCRTPSHRCWRPRRHHWREPKGMHAHDGVRVGER